MLKQFRYAQKAKASDAAAHPSGHSIVLLQGSKELFPALVDAIDAAQSMVHLETYTFDLTDTGSDVAHALVRAAQRGVCVRLVADGVGTDALPEPWELSFRESGVQYVVYSPLNHWGLLMPKRWRRLHRKLCTIDGHTLFCGGINILDDMHDPNHGALEGPRFDFSVKVKGALVNTACQTMEHLWWRMQAARDARQRHLPSALHALHQAGVADIRANPDRDPTIRACLVVRDNVRNRTSIERAYLHAMGLAKEEIIIANAYFLPGGRLRKALVKAAQRGVRVRLLLQGRYEYFMQYHACRPVYQTLLNAGVEIYEYEPSFLHAKVAVIDGGTEYAWATVGSSNLDPLSLLLAREANIVVQSPTFAQDLRQRLLAAIDHGGQRVPVDCYAHRNGYQRFLDRLAYGLMRLALWGAGRKY